MKVLKFGGSSVASAENIEKVVKIVLDKVKQDAIILVVSAFGGVTDQLINAGRASEKGDESFRDIVKQIETRHIDIVRSLISVSQQSGVISDVKKHLNTLEGILEGIFLIRELSAKTLDSIVSYGELLSSYIIFQKIKSIQDNCSWQDARTFIKTNAKYNNAIVDFTITNKLIEDTFLNASGITLVPGFIASTEDNATTTLGRGGSDYTAAIIAAALNTDDLEIWTDVSGMMTADPRVVSQAYPIAHISYQEAMELSHFGAKVIYPPTIQPVMDSGISVWIKNTFSPNDYGTLIEKSPAKKSSQFLVSGISSITQISLLNLEGSGMVGIPGISMRLFGALARANVNVMLISQASSEYSICVAVKTDDAPQAQKAVDEEFANERANHKIAPLAVQDNLSVVALVGDDMKMSHGISGKMFACLGKNGVNILAIAQGSSERNISVIIRGEDVKKALNVLHEEFFEQPLKQVNIFLGGVGNVGGKLIEQIAQQTDFLKERSRLHLRVVGLINSKKAYFNEEGINLNTWKSDLERLGVAMDITAFRAKVVEMNLRNSVFVDNTASVDVAKSYAKFLENSISVVASNKIACSSPIEEYKNLKSKTLSNRASFYYETNVGAGLPVIGTLGDMISSGDQIISIKAVLSGTMNFVFSNFVAGTVFADIVKQAQSEGYTEPDPRIDLSGIDVARKILILARESGANINIEDVLNVPYMPEDCFQTSSVEEFYKKMHEYTAHFDKLLADADAKGHRLKYVATYEKGKASVGLESVDSSHPFFNLAGKDNMVIFSTSRYKDQPMIVKGAGAGAEVTASGVFADIIRCVR